MADMGMVEKVARAIYEERRRNGSPEVGVHMSGEQWRIHLPEARAAIEAMPLADAVRWIETLAEPHRFGPVTEEKRQAALAFVKPLYAILKEEGNG